ncbi:hypothetical protein SK642_1821 [Streptococcus mitis]|uniref:Uncharacterized protein n=1 Tax=Streptococcus mitis TaxID=28037 RepID=A0A081Q9R6_STRMT|nr:hypothetical protein SK642_1821 [Streptococcus mitis]
MYSFLIPKNVITAFLSSLGEVVIFLEVFEAMYVEEMYKDYRA